MSYSAKNMISGAVLILILGGIFSLLGVYDSDKMPFIDRYVFWTSTIGVGLVAVAIATKCIKPSAKNYHFIFKLAVLSIFSSAPVTLVLNFFSTGFKTSWPLQEWLIQFCLAFFISIVILAIIYSILKNMNMLQLNTKMTNSTTSTFLQRLPVKYKSARLYAVSSEDHYLKVHTDMGHELILMRLSDALRELSEADGMQVHRSWWVARKGIFDSYRHKNKSIIVLKTKIEAPVSRTYTKMAKEKGFI